MVNSILLPTKYLPGRVSVNMRKPEISGHLQQIYLPQQTKDYLFLSADIDTNTHKENRERYVSTLKSWSSSWPNGSLDTASPHPVLVTKQHLDQLSQLHEALSLAIEDTIERWWTDDAARFPERMPLEAEEEDVLRWLHQNRQLRPYKGCQGSWRPDFLLEHDADLGTENFRICEINARFCWNGYMHAAFGQEAYSVFDLEQRGLVNAADPGTVLGGLLGQFDCRNPLHIVKGNEHGIDVYMFVEFCQRLGIKTRLITPDSLRLIPHREGHNGYKLFCLNPDQPPRHGEKVEEIHQLGLELQQRELRALSPEMKRQISLRGFNDMRTILLTHDKRMLGIVLQELSSLVTRNILSAEQAARLEKGIAPTILPGSPELEDLIDRSRASEQLKDEYILKPIRSGKGDGIQFGDQLSYVDWQAKLEELRDAKLKPGLTLYVVQRKINQPLYNVTLGSGQSMSCHKVGTYHAVNGRFVGLGTWRCSPGRLCAVCDGASWITSVVREE